MNESVTCGEDSMVIRDEGLDRTYEACQDFGMD